MSLDVEGWFSDDPTLSIAQQVALLPLRHKRKILNGLDPKQLAFDYDFWARPSQRYPDGDWRFWLCCCGRGWGKTWVGAQTVRQWAKDPNAIIALVGRTAADVRDVMVGGNSGILALSPDDERPIYNPSKRCLIWPNGAKAYTYSAEKPDQLRGPQHGRLWADELAAWQYPDAWDQAMFGLRLGDDPRAIITTTPRPTPEVKELADDANTVLSTGSTYENEDNLADAFIDNIVKKYEGTRLGRQELHAEILDDNPNALWTHALIDMHRVQKVPDFARIVVGIDPAVTSNEDSDETGLVVMGVTASEHLYVLRDASGNMKTTEWAAKAVALYHEFGADAIVPEKNNGGDLVEDAILNIDRNVRVKPVWASRGKYTRAEPIAGLYEQGRVHHVGVYAALEDQMTSFDTVNTKKSPDRMDALVHAATDLALEREPELRIR